ncbi:hypothetical protein [Christiangramia sediminis]|uniref:Uncharacterized protein n=1 Tax=Christiangramia sediminis TaxID=2881336 RepID=A0A9X1LLB6_9FLAO|nr:hypothetical protein [Christiangramia sediminis]MCB7482483.1 hypothetical protein [Christiangramia sediminis]
MKRLSILAGGLLMFSTILTSCRDTAEKETVIREVEVEKKVETPEEVEEKEGILERTAKEVDKEVNKEIDEEIEKIGDDN